MAVNANFWRKFPVADRDQGFNADQAITRIQQASAGSVETFNQAFLWRSDSGPPNNKNSYRLPVADVINGRFTLIPHAVFTAAAILQGAHGGLEGVVGDKEKEQLRGVVSAIYKVLRDTYSDPRVVPPWERQDTPPDQRPNRQITASILNSDLAQLTGVQLMRLNGCGTGPTVTTGSTAKRFWCGTKTVPRTSSRTNTRSPMWWMGSCVWSPKALPPSRPCTTAAAKASTCRRNCSKTSARCWPKSGTRNRKVRTL